MNLPIPAPQPGFVQPRVQKQPSAFSAFAKRFTEWQEKQPQQQEACGKQQQAEKQGSVDEMVTKALLKQLEEIFELGSMPELEYIKRKTEYLEKLVDPVLVEESPEIEQLLDIFKSGYLPEVEYLKRRAQKVQEIIDRVRDGET